jgi:DNA-binding protein H-NS
MMTLQELLHQQATLNQQISAIRMAERARAIADIRTLMAQHGLTAADLSVAYSAAHKRDAKTASKKVAAKYRDPVTGATWTGRGLKPKWMAEAVACGKTPSDFAI